MGRLKFEHDGRVIYEWEQTLDEVNIYIQAPPNISSNLLNIKISHNHLIIGIKNNDTSFIDEDTFSTVKVNESTWTLSDGEICINLQKMRRGEAWETALLGRDMINKTDIHTKEEIKKKLMKERFQEEVC